MGPPPTSSFALTPLACVTVHSFAGESGVGFALPHMLQPFCWNLPFYLASLPNEHRYFVSMSRTAQCVRTCTRLRHGSCLPAYFIGGEPHLLLTGCLPSRITVLLAPSRVRAHAFIAFPPLPPRSLARPDSPRLWSYALDYSNLPCTRTSTKPCSVSDCSAWQEP